MNITIKNERIIPWYQKHAIAADQMYELEDRIPDKVRFWLATHVEEVTLAFLSSLFECAECNKIDLDLTYESIHSLPAALQKEFHEQTGTYSLEKNISLIRKTLASYLTLLAMNEQGYWIKAFPVSPADLRRSSKPDSEFWAERFHIRTGKNFDVDFLPCCQEAVKKGTVLTANGFTVTVEPIVKYYFKKIGVDLSKYNFKDFYGM